MPPGVRFLTFAVGEPIVVLEPFHRSKRNALAHVLQLLRDRYPDATDGALKARSYSLRRGGTATPFSELVSIAQTTGTVPALYGHAYRGERFFPHGITTTSRTSGPSMATTHMGVETTAEMPMRLAPIEEELAGDILSHRIDVCRASGGADLKDCGRFFRAYVASACSLVEMFLHRVEFVSSRQDADAAPIVGTFDAVVEQWVGRFCDGGLGELKSSVSWDYHLRLRRQRSAFLHPKDTQIATSMRSLVEGMNWVREGVGGFLRRLRSMQGLPSLPFVERLATAPRVRFRPDDFRAK